MKKMILSTFLLLAVVVTNAQQNARPTLYNPKDNAAVAIENAVKKAKAEGKHVLLQIGGNWCVWCIRFDNYIKADAQLDSMMKASYVVYHLNWSPENKNEDILAKLEYPQRFGFPVFVVLDGDGKRIHTQDSGLLEQGESYNKGYVRTFFDNWSKNALNPANYKQ